MDPIINAMTALRTDRLEGYLTSLSLEEQRVVLSAQVETRYANWFSGVGMTLLQLTAFVQPQSAPALLARGAELDLYTACALGDVAFIERCLSSTPGALNDCIDAYYPLQFGLGQPDTLRHLLRSGDDANRPLQKMGWFEWEDQAAEQGLAHWRPIHMVALGRGGDRIESAEVLLEHGADLLAPSMPLGETALHIAAIYDQTMTVQWLLAHGVSVDIGTRRPHAAVSTLFDQTPFAPFDAPGKTALMLALGEGHAGVVSALLAAGADCDARDDAGFTPLHYAAGSFWSERVDLVDLLLACGAYETNAQGDQGPLDVAAQKGYQSVVDRLVSAGG